MDIVFNFKQFINEKNKTNNLTELIKIVRDKFIKGKIKSYSDINRGYCVDFIDEIQDKFSDDFETLTTSQFVISDEERKQYLISTYNDKMIDYDDVTWSKNMLDEYGYPPEYIMDEEPSSHIWIYYNGKHYDAEEPNGVENPWDLPIFQL
jgi:hypothetical protein